MIDVEPWHRARRVLVVRLDNLGDVLMSTPAIGALRESLPEARITLLASAAGAALGAHVDAIDAAIVYDAPWVRHPGAKLDTIPGAADRAMVERLAAGAYDAAVIFTVCTQSALPAAMLCRLAGIPLRLAHSRENPYELLTHWVRDTDTVRSGMRHEVRRQLDLVASIGARVRDERLRLAVEPAAQERVRALLRGAGLSPGERYFVVHPGASAASRRWPAANFGMAADALMRATGAHAVYTGSADEKPLVDEARAPRRMHSIDFAGRLDLADLAALIGGAEVLIANNSGPAHIAAATATPVAVLYALTNPQHTPWRVPSRVLFHDVPCRHCLKSDCPHGHHDCLARVTPQQVVQAALELIDRREPASWPIHPITATA